MKTHLKIKGVDYRGRGQSNFEYEHQTACGYVRVDVTTNEDLVDCKHCLKSEAMEKYHKLNSTFTDSRGCY